MDNYLQSKSESIDSLHIMDQQGKIRKVFMNYSGPETFSISREELRHDSYNEALTELYNWLQKYDRHSEVKELRAAVLAVIEKTGKA